jgi:MFS family permease
MAEAAEVALGERQLAAAEASGAALEPLPRGQKAWLGAFVARHRFLLAFAALSSLMGISVGVAKVTTSLYAVHLGASPEQLGLIAGAQSVGVLLMSLPLGFMVEQLGPGRIFVLGTLAAAALYALVPLHPSAPYLLLCTTLISFFMPFRFVSLNSVFMAQLEQLGEGKAGWYRGTHMLGMFLLGPALAAVVLRALDFAGTYQAIALAFVGTIALSPIVFGPYAPARGGLAPVARGGRGFSAAALLEQLALMGRDEELRGICAIEALAQGTNAYYSFFIVVVAMEVVGLDRAQASSLVAANGVSYVLALLSLGGLARRLGSRRVYRVGFLWAAAALLVLGVARTQATLWLGALCLGLGLGSLQIVNLTRFARCGARLGRGKMAGLNGLVAPAGSVLGNIAGGVVGKAFGVQAMFLVLAPLFVLASLTLAAGGAPPAPLALPDE